MADLFDFAKQTQAILRPQPAALAAALLAQDGFSPLPAVGAAIRPSLRTPSLGRTRLPAIPTTMPSTSDALWVGAATHIEVMGQPSLKLVFENGETRVKLQRLTQYAAHLDNGDLSGIRRLMADVQNMLVAGSQGPYSVTDLREMGHPYGKDIIQDSHGNVSKMPRRLQRYHKGKSIGHIAGVRGSVPTKSVVNRQSGHFAKSWDMKWEWTPGGLEIVWSNSAKSDKGFAYSWALAAGTPKMQAHGPFTYAPLRYMAQIDAEWRRVTRIGWQRSQMDTLMSILNEK